MMNVEEKAFEADLCGVALRDVEAELLRLTATEYIPRGSCEDVYSYVMRAREIQFTVIRKYRYAFQKWECAQKQRV